MKTPKKTPSKRAAIKSRMVSIVWYLGCLKGRSRLQNTVRGCRTIYAGIASSPGLGLGGQSRSKFLNLTVHTHTLHRIR